MNWREEWFDFSKNCPHGFWMDISTQKVFLNQLSKDLKIKKSRDWGLVTHDQINSYGGSSLLNYYKGSLFNVLQIVYPGI